jgi:DNA-binding LacI/PurR family transcriptional regulator
MALRGTGRISENTRRRIRDTAEEMGYRPDPLLSAFSRHRQKGASPGSVLALISQAPYADWQSPIVSTANRLGYRLEVFCRRDYPSQQALVRTLEARGIAGVIFMEDRASPVLEKDLWSPFRGVQCGPYPSGDDADSPFPIVRHNPFDAVSVAWRKGIEAGFQRPALLLLTKNQRLDTVEDKTLAGYLYRQQREFLDRDPLRPRVFRLDETDQAQERETTRQWIAENRPDLIISGSLRGYQHLLECDFEVPGDFPVIVVRKSRAHPEVAGLVLDRIAVTQTAVFHLHTIIQHGPELQDTHAATVVLNPNWMDGTSFPAG